MVSSSGKTNSNASRSEIPLAWTSRFRERPLGKNGYQ
jgi:hypothetical protein